MKTILIFLTIFLTQTCNKKVSDFEILEKLPSEIETVYFQNWVGGIESAGSGTIFYIQFKNKSLMMSSTFSKTLCSPS